MRHNDTQKVLLTCQPLQFGVSNPGILSPQLNANNQRFHPGVTLRITAQKECVFQAAPVLHTDVGLKQLLSVLELYDGDSGVWYHLRKQNIIDENQTVTHEYRDDFMESARVRFLFMSYELSENEHRST